ncbi:MAG: family 16 glycoside hydrolase [Planctomycetota bacterium]|jgi:hypothetical protein
MACQKKLFLITAFAAICIGSSVLRAVDTKPSVVDIIIKMPAESSAARDALTAELVKLGPEAVKEICEMLLPAGIGDNTKIEYALHGMATYVCRPGAEAERKMFAEALVEALESARYDEVKVFIISQLQLAGGEECVASLGELLTNKRLCEPAARSLLSIHTPSATKEFVNALPRVKGANRVTVIKALGEMRAKEVADKLIEYADSNDLNTRQIALYAIANIAESISAPEPVGKGFIRLFNGKDLTGWKRHEGLPEHGLAGKWTVEDGAIVGVQDPPGKGGFLTTLQQFQDFELTLETKIDWPFDSGIFLRVGPDGKSHQVTLDYRPGGEVGGIYLPWTHGFVHHCSEGVKHFKKDAWNKVRILCRGEPAKISVWINDALITDFRHTAETTSNVPEEGMIALQIHPGGEGYEKSKARFRNIFIREIPRKDTIEILTEQEKAEGFVPLFNGKNLSGWTGVTDGYFAQDGKIICPKQLGGNLYTEREYSDFILRFEFKLTPGANNGLGIRAPLHGNAAYAGMEIQILDNTADKYSNLKPWQYHGSVYGVLPAKRGHLKPVGEWNFEEVIAQGRQITVRLNGVIIVDADIYQASTPAPIDGKDHSGLRRNKGHIGFLGHGSHVEFRNIRLKELK